MTKNSLEKIKGKFNKIDSNRYWGDDYDVRYFLLHKLSKIKNKTILDIGGGIGVISSEIDSSNFCVNLDISFEDLKKCNKSFGKLINVLNGTMTNLGFNEKSFDYVICSNILEVAKYIDLQNTSIKNYDSNVLPTIDKVLDEIFKVLKLNGILFLTTPNNEYYKTIKLTYNELEHHINKKFKNYSIFLYNTFPKLSSKNRKLNMANVFPKILSKIKNREKIIRSLVKSKSKKSYSVSFFVEAKKEE